MEEVQLWSLDGSDANQLKKTGHLESESGLEDILIKNPDLLMEGLTKAEELIQNSRMVIDSTGKTRAVQIDYAMWVELLELLESLAEGAKPEQVKSEPKDNADDQDDAWITEQLNEVCTEVDTSLDPALAAIQWASLPREDWSEVYKEWSQGRR